MRPIRVLKYCSPDVEQCAPIETMFDTGATHSMIKEEVLKRDFPGAHVTPTKKDAGLGDGKATMNLVGTVDLDVEVVEGKPAVREHFYVATDLVKDAIFGALGMEANELEISMKKPSREPVIKFRTGRPPQVQLGSTNIIRRKLLLRKSR